MKLIALATLTALLAGAHATAQDAAQSAVAPHYVLGTNYQAVGPTSRPHAAGQPVEVVEVFWYGCPHCAAFDPYVESWLKGIPSDVKFERVPVTWNPVARLHARAFYAAQTLGRIEALHSALFKEIQTNGNALDTEEKVVQWFAQMGIEPARFKEAFESAAVSASVEHADELMHAYKIDNVPSMVVDGRYSSNALRAGGFDDLLRLVDELVGRERAEQ
jgi:protein dithiol oxidoreductase (disulfide-forming)